MRFTPDVLARLPAHCISSPASSYICDVGETETVHIRDVKVMNFVAAGPQHRPNRSSVNSLPSSFRTRRGWQFSNVPV